MMLNIYYLSLQETTTNVTNSTEPPDNLQFTFNITYLKPEVDDNPRSDGLNVDDDDEEEETDEAVGDNLFSDLYSEEGFLDDADDVVIETSQTSTPATTTTTTTSKLPTSPRHEPENDVFPLNGYLYDSDGGNVRSNVDLTTLLAKLKSERDKTTARLQTSPHTPFLLKSDVSKFEYTAIPLHSGNRQISTTESAVSEEDLEEEYDLEEFEEDLATSTSTTTTTIGTILKKFWR